MTRTAKSLSSLLLVLAPLTLVACSSTNDQDQQAMATAQQAQATAQQALATANEAKQEADRVNQQNLKK
jgi:hypothetical protein